MTWHGEPPPDDDELFGRPYLAGLPPDPGVPPDPGRPPGPGYPPGPEYPPAPGYAPGPGYPPAPGYPPGPGYAPGPARYSAPPSSAHHDEVRPYLLTGGRTHVTEPSVAMETIVMATGVRSVQPPQAAGLERASIIRLAERPCSAAEVAARLHLPLQVALVLVSDLVAEGLLDATAVGNSQADDVLFLERLIAGVAAL